MLIDFGNLDGAKGYALNVLVVALQKLDKLIPLGTVKIWYDQEHDFHNATFEVDGDTYLLQKYKRITFWKNPIEGGCSILGFTETHPKRAYPYDDIGMELQMIFATDMHTYGPDNWPGLWPPKKQWVNDPRAAEIILAS